MGKTSFSQALGRIFECVRQIMFTHVPSLLGQSARGGAPFDLDNDGRVPLPPVVFERGDRTKTRRHYRRHTPPS